MESGRPDRVGDYKDVHPLRVDPRRTNYDIFRIRGWVRPLIVSDRLKTAMEEIDNLGVVFEPVTEPRGRCVTTQRRYLVERNPHGRQRLRATLTRPKAMIEEI